MIVIGLTGSIGAGKSTAACMLRRMGVPVHEADRAVRRAYECSAVRRAIRDKAPELAAGDDIDRRRTAQKAFADPDFRIFLENLLHPYVWAEQNDFLRQHKRMGLKMAALDIPLLFEAQAWSRVDHVAVLWAPPFVQQKRVLQRPGMERTLFEQIRASQWPDRAKCRAADSVIPTGLGRARTWQALHRMTNKIQNKTCRTNAKSCWTQKRRVWIRNRVTGLSRSDVSK